MTSFFYRIQDQFFWLFFVLLLLATGSIGWFSFKKTEEAVISNAMNRMKDDMEEILQKSDVFHDQAKSAMVFALENRVFKEYFSLPETMKGHQLDAKGSLVLTDRQVQLRNELNQWTHSLQKRFPIVETCIIDRSGQEHTRITRGVVAANEELSSNESSAVFFKSSFELTAGKVHVSQPYMSPDVAEWVFAYTSPVILDDGSTPAFYHFEIPIALFQNFLTDASIVSTSGHTNSAADPLADRLFILTIDGLVIVDTNQKIDFKRNKSKDTEQKEAQELKDYLPHIRSISNDRSFLALMEKARTGIRGTGRFDLGSTQYFVSFKPMSQFDWSMVRIQSYGHLLQGDTSLAHIRDIILVLALIILALGFIAVRVVAGRITRPLELLSTAMHDLEENRFRDDIPVASQDELGRIIRVFNTMSREIHRNQMFLLKERNKLTTIIHSTREGIVVSDQDNIVVLVNPAAEHLLHKTWKQIQTEGFFNLVDDPGYVEAMIEENKSSIPETIIYKDRVLHFYASSFFASSGEKVGSVALIRDVTQEKKLEEELRRISFTDKLTGLYNRRWLEEFMSKELSRASRYHLDLSLLFFDVDHFKKFNDTHGHDKGDLVLEKVGEAARSGFRQTDYACRYGGEEFCIILTNTAASEATLVAEHFRQQIERMEIESMKVTISIGIASYPDAHIKSPTELLKCADIALYSSKKSGRNRSTHWNSIAPDDLP